MTKLKPCPFCGGYAELHTAPVYGALFNSFVCCMSCGCRTPIWEEDHAIELWNRRTNNEHE